MLRAQRVPRSVGAAAYKYPPASTDRCSHLTPIPALSAAICHHGDGIAGATNPSIPPLPPPPSPSVIRGSQRSGRHFKDGKLRMEGREKTQREVGWWCGGDAGAKSHLQSGAGREVWGAQGRENPPMQAEHCRGAASMGRCRCPKQSEGRGDEKARGSAVRKLVFHLSCRADLHSSDNNLRG